MALVVATLVAMSPSCASTNALTAPVMTPDGVRFTFMHSEARSVALAGAFNEWSASSRPLSRIRSSGVWTIVVPLPPGEHLFMYVVDGTQWVSPQVAEDYVDDRFGARNGVVVVRPKER